MPGVSKLHEESNDLILIKLNVNYFYERHVRDETREPRLTHMYPADGYLAMRWVRWGYIPDSIAVYRSKPLTYDIIAIRHRFVSHVIAKTENMFI